MLIKILLLKGTLIWKISDVLEKLEEGRHKLCGDGLELISSPFYTSQFGYKLQASVFLNGNGSGENTHVSVYIKILPGEFDALLKWSFSHSVAFTLFDQSEKVCNSKISFTFMKLTYYEIYICTLELNVPSINCIKHIIGITKMYIMV